MYDELKRYKTKKKKNLILSIVFGLLLVFSLFMEFLNQRFKVDTISGSPRTELIYNKPINKLIYPIADYNDTIYYCVQSFSLPSVSTRGNWVVYYIDNTDYCIVLSNLGTTTSLKIIERSQVGSTDQTIGTFLCSYSYSNYMYTRSSSSSGYIKTSCQLIRIGQNMPGYQGYFSQANVFSNSPVSGVDYSNQYYITDNTAGDVDYSLAYKDGYNVGIDDGKIIGYDNGFLDGKTAVQTNPNNYNLYSETQYINYGNSKFNEGADTDLSTKGFKVLLNQIFNSPYNILHNILNFEIFGVNLWALFSFLFTCGLIVFVIKLFRK